MNVDDERAFFRVWLQNTYMLDAHWDEQRKCFKEFPPHIAFQAWLAAKEHARKVLALERMVGDAQKMGLYDDQDRTQETGP